MPAPWADVCSAINDGHLLCRRRFGCPTCLDPHEQVWLVIERPALCGEVRLNDEPLGPLGATTDPTEFDITSRLRERNELSLEFHVPGVGHKNANDLLFADVRLEIRG
jgi:hypothetical protein